MQDWPGAQKIVQEILKEDEQKKEKLHRAFSQWKDVMTNRLQNSQVQVAVEMWRYNPRKMSMRNVVDELLLALALREDADERVEEAVEEMLNELWKKIDGYRN